MASIATVEKLNSQLAFNAFHASSISIPPWKRHPCRSVLKSHFGKCVVFRGYRNGTLVWNGALLQHGVLRKKCPYSELFWSAFSRIRTQYREIRSTSPHSVRMLENKDQNNSEYGHFSRMGLSKNRQNECQISRERF